MKSLQKSLLSVKELAGNIRDVMKLAFEIDSHLMSRYYLTAFVGGVTPVLAPFVLRFFIDALIRQGQVPQAATIPTLLIYLLAGYFLMQFINTSIYWGLNVLYYDYLLRNRLQSGLMLRFSKKLAQLDVQHLEDSETQNLITKVRDSYQWQIPDFVRVWNYIFSNGISVIGAFIVLFPFGWWLPLLITLVTLPRFYMKLRHGNFVWSMYGSGAPQAKKLWYYSWLLTEQIPIQETRIFQSQEALFKKMEETQDFLYQKNKKPLDNYRWVVIFAPMFEITVTFSIIVYFIPQVMTGAMTVGALTLLINALELLRNSTAWIASQFGELYEKNLFIKPFFELMNLPKLIKEKKNPHIFSKIDSPLIEFKNVFFSYPNEKHVLKDVSFSIQPGENVALVGNNGAGKSTIIKLLCRFYDVTKGEIRINGVNIQDLQMSNWFAHLGTLFQDFMKYQFTIRENIMLGKPDVVDEKRMFEAAVQSGAYEFIKHFPKQFDQVLGKRFEDGDELSGGQWQKLAIARAFYQQAPVLIMDEPTSAIDAEAEYEIFNNLEKLYKDKTLILVSHRFSTVRNANKIIVIDGGEVKETGTHEELLATNGKYASMFMVQAQGYK